MLPFKSSRLHETTLKIHSIFSFSVFISLSTPPPHSLATPPLGLNVGGADTNQEEAMLENWIKELEQGIKGMSDVVGLPEEASTVSYTH